MFYTIINLTPHTINLNNGDSFPASGMLARVDVTQKQTSPFPMIDFPFEFHYNSYGNVVVTDKDGQTVTLRFIDDNGLPILYIVSAMVLDKVTGRNKHHFIGPNTSSKDVVRNDKGHILSVPGFVTPSYQND